MKTSLLLFLLLFVPGVLWANGGEVKDTISNTYYDKTIQFRPQQLILPASLILVGSWGVCNGFLQSVNHSVKDQMTDLRKNRFFHADDYIQYLPVISYAGLGLIGVKSKHSFKERLIITATSYLAMGIMVNGTKLAIDEKRPDSSAENSFPSGHTATAFMGAELVRIEYGPGYGISAYLIASSVAALRLYNNRHWLNDVLAGAGIGILSARIGYWLLPVNKRLFRLNRKETAMIITSPFYDHENQAFGAALSIRF